MVTIQTVKTNKETGEPIYKDYRCIGDDGIKNAMDSINYEKDNNDLNIYYPINIYNVFES